MASDDEKFERIVEQFGFLRDPVVTPDPELWCHLCGKPGAEGHAGQGQVPGVPVHLKCWMEEGDG